MRKVSLNKQQSGLVSIIVTMILIIVLSITVIGFAQIARREQRQALDRQLSTQAYYAAESAVNEKVSAIKAGTLSTNIDTCSTSGARGDVGSAEYTCVLVDQTPTSLEYGAIDPSKSQIIPIKAESGTINTIKFSWNDKDSNSNFSTNFPNFPAQGSWTGDTGILEVSLTPLTGYNRSSLVANTFTVYLYPSSGSGVGDVSYSTNPTNQGQIIGGQCNSASTPKFCNAQITGLNAANYIVRVRSIYKANSMTITATGTASPVRFKGTQAVVDATGKASDVLRRVQVRVPTVNNYDFPEYVLDSADSICKRLSVWPGGVTTDSDPACAIN